MTMTKQRSRWRKEALRDIQTLHPDQLRPILGSKRLRHLECVDAYLDRIEMLISRDPQTASDLVVAAPDYAKDVLPEDFDRQARAWALQGSIHRIFGEIQEAELNLARRAIEILPATSLEAPSVWTQLAALRCDQGRLAEAQDLVKRAIDYLRASHDERKGTCDRYSLAAVLIYDGIVKWREGQLLTVVSESFLEALKESSVATPLSRVLASQNLAVAAGIAWLQGETQLYPAEVLNRIGRLHRDLHRDGHRASSPCRSRLVWVEGLALAYLAQSLTRAAEKRFSNARGYLLDIGAQGDVILLNLDFGYWLIRERRWTDLQGIAGDTLRLATRMGFETESVEALRQWETAARQRVVADQVLKSVYRRIRGVSSLALESAKPLPETDPLGW